MFKSKDRLIIDPADYQVWFFWLLVTVGGGGGFRVIADKMN